MSLRVLCLGFAIVFLARQVQAGIEPQAGAYASSPDGAWRYSTSLTPEAPGFSTTYYPQAESDFSSAVFQSYVVADAVGSQIVGGDYWQGGTQSDDTQKFQIFSTWVKSDTTQSIDLKVVGDDGHSLFVDHAFVAGGGFGSQPSQDISFQAGVPRQIVLAGYNGGSAWDFGIGLPAPAPEPGQPLTHPFSDSLQQIPGIHLNANGFFPPLTTTNSVSNLNQPDFPSDASDKGASASSFTTSNSVLVLKSITAQVTGKVTAYGEMRIRKDQGGKPGALVGSLGFNTAQTIAPYDAVFRSTGMLLDPNTTYWVTLDERLQDPFEWDVTIGPGSSASQGLTINPGIYLGFNDGQRWDTYESDRTQMFEVDAQAALPGDFNLDGVVDAADYVVWRDGLGVAYTQSDYNVWRTHFGATAGSGSQLPGRQTASVPEPATVFLVLLGTCYWTVIGRAGRA